MHLRPEIKLSTSVDCLHVLAEKLNRLIRNEEHIDILVRDDRITSSRDLLFCHCDLFSSSQRACQGM